MFVRPSVHTFKHEYFSNQWADSNQISTEASLWWGKGCIKFWARSDQNSGCQHSSVFFFDRIFRSSFLQVTRTSIISRKSSKFSQIGPRPVELAALDRLEKSPYYNKENNVNTLALSFLVRSSLFLQVIRTTLTVRMSSKFRQIQLRTAELHVTAIERLINRFKMLSTL